MISLFTRAFAIAVVLVALGIPSEVRARSTEKAENAATLFQNVRIFDGRNTTLSAAMHVLVRGNTIERITKDAAPDDLVANAKIIAGGGRTLMPGLIDMHWHTMLVRPTPAELLTGDIGHLNLEIGRAHV